MSFWTALLLSPLLSMLLLALVMIAFVAVAVIIYILATSLECIESNPMMSIIIIALAIVLAAIL